MSMAATVGKGTETGELLKRFVERIERVRVEKKDLGDDERAIFAEAKAEGFDTKTIRRIIKRRESDPAALEEADSLLDTYAHALGMATEAPLFRAVGLMSVDLAMRAHLIDGLGSLVPVNGAITVQSPGAAVRLRRRDDGIVIAEDVDPEPEREDEPSALTPGPSPRRGEGGRGRARKGRGMAVDWAGAREMGRAAGARKSTEKNPFPKDDSRRAEWDAGYRAGLEGGPVGDDGDDDGEGEG